MYASRTELTLRKTGFYASLAAVTLLASCIGPAITITAITLPTAIEGTSYTQILSADTAARWEVVDGALPSGMRLTGDGVLTGTPGEDGTFYFTVQATRTSGLSSRTGTQEFTLDVTPRLILTVDLEIPQVGVVYSDAVEAIGGTPPYSFSVVGLTAGLALNESTGAVTGTPVTATSGVTVQFEVTDSGDPAQTDTVQVALEINPAPIIFVTTELPNGSVGTGYLETVEIDQGQGPFTFTVTAGVLPNGLELTRSTGVISGTPEAAGSSTFTIEVEDSEVPPNITSQEFTITVE